MRPPLRIFSGGSKAQQKSGTTSIESDALESTANHLPILRDDTPPVVAAAWQAESTAVLGCAPIKAAALRRGGHVAPAAAGAAGAGLSSGRRSSRLGSRGAPFVVPQCVPAMVLRYDRVEIRGPDTAIRQARCLLGISRTRGIDRRRPRHRCWRSQRERPGLRHRRGCNRMRAPRPARRRMRHPLRLCQ